MVPQSAHDSRSFRLVSLLAILCVLHAFDYAFTLAQIERGNFLEMNTVAAALLDAPAALAAFKASCFGTGVLILYRMRRHWQAECGAWFLLVVSIGLMAWWLAYLHCVEICLADPVAGCLPPVRY
jgi:hypothetical protein